MGSHLLHLDSLEHSENNNCNAIAKSRELFDFCDTDRKGYLTRDDFMHKLKGELPLTDAQLNEVFNTLDENHDERLEPQDFAGNFEMFLAIAENSADNPSSKKVVASNVRSLSPIKEITTDPYDDFLEILGCKTQFKDDDHLRSVWKHITENNPSLLPDFESFLRKTTVDMENIKVGCISLQTSYHARSNESEEHLCQLYKRLESKMAADEAELLAQENTNFEKMRQQLENDVNQKSRLLLEVRMQHDLMKTKLSQMKIEEEQRRKENVQLIKERDALDEKLRQAEKLRLEIENEYKVLSAECSQTKKRHEKSVDKVSSSLSIEEEIIASEIKRLSNQNKVLIDQKDMTGSSDMYRVDSLSDAECENDKLPSSACDDEYNQSSGSTDSLYKCLHPVAEDRDKFEKDFENSLRLFSCATSLSSHLRNEEIISSTYGNTHSKMTWKITCKMLVNVTFPYQKMWKVKMKTIYPSLCRNYKVINEPESSQPVSINSITVPVSPVIENLPTELTPMFKVIFIGDCGVGKTSFIQRFCANTFRSTFQSTIGIDFQEKELIANNKRIRLQLWDTAGQERFRSLCQQYFRKVDGAVVMYDTADEQSYKNVRRWMTSIYDSTDGDIVIMLIGNKVDLSSRRIDSFTGNKLAEDFKALFFETSALTGLNVLESMEAVSILLQQKIHRDREKMLQLKDTCKQAWKVKRWC